MDNKLTPEWTAFGFKGGEKAGEALNGADECILLLDQSPLNPEMFCFW